jgi:hypothetical protein
VAREKRRELQAVGLVVDATASTVVPIGHVVSALVEAWEQS